MNTTFKYLINDICIFTPLSNFDINVKKNIVSCCLFKMENSGYKDITKYISGLTTLNALIKDKFENFVIRLFIDDSIYEDKELLNEIFKLELIQIIKYDCPNYKLKHMYHEGLFGTLVRFFPMFDFECNDADLVILTDVDYCDFIEPLMKLVNIIKDHNKLDDIYIFKASDITKSIFYENNLYYNDIIDTYAIAPSFASIKRLSSFVIYNFLEEVRKNKRIYSYYYKHEFGVVNNYEKKYNNNSDFIYGIDEYFLNNTLQKYLTDNKLKYAIQVKFKIYNMLRYSKKRKLNDDQLKLLNSAMNDVLASVNIYKSNLSVHAKFAIIRSIMKNDSQKNKQYKIALTTYKLFLYAHDKQFTFLFPPDFYKLLMKDEYFGAYDFDTIKFYNMTYPDIIIKKEKFKTNDIQRFKTYAINHKLINHK